MDPSTFENDLKECMSKQWFVDKINQCTYSYTKSPERNRLQNCFLEPEFQNLVIKKFVNIEQELPSADINRFYETEYYNKFMTGKRFTLDSEINIKFNHGTLWDVEMTHFYTGHVMECSMNGMDTVNYYKQKVQETLKSESITIFTHHKSIRPTIVFKLNHLDNTLKIRCLIKPTLGDEYPSVLGAMNANLDGDDGYTYHVLLVEHFSAAYTSKEQLIQIFKYSSIDVLFYNDLIGYNSLQET
jgi:hypothetical protein